MIFLKVSYPGERGPTLVIGVPPMRTGSHPGEWGPTLRFVVCPPWSELFYWGGLLIKKFLMLRHGKNVIYSKLVNNPFKDVYWMYIYRSENLQKKLWIFFRFSHTVLSQLGKQVVRGQPKSFHFRKNNGWIVKKCWEHSVEVLSKKREFRHLCPSVVYQQF